MSAYQYGIEIPQNSDLDTYKTPGKYVSHSSSVTSTIENSPFSSGGFRLEVRSMIDPNNGASIQQIAYPGNMNAFKQFAIRTFLNTAWDDWRYFSDDATLISSNRIWRTVTVYSNGDFKDCNDIPVNCVGNTYSTALNRPNDGTGQLFAIICIGSEVDRYKAQYAFPSQTYINKIQYRFYNYINREWSEWTSI